MVQRERERETGRYHGPVAKKARTVAVAIPHLARGRSENLMQSRSCTPSDDDEHMEEAEAASTSTIVDAMQQRNDHTSERQASTASLDPQIVRNLSIVTTNRSASANTYLQSEELKKEDSHGWESACEDEGLEGQDATSKGVDASDKAQVSYPIRLNESQQTSVWAFRSPFDTASSPSVTSPASRRYSGTGLRPIAKRPAGVPHDIEFPGSSEHPARVTKGKAKGIKTPYKSQQERDKVKQVRLYGACLRCKIMRQPCQVTAPGQPCDNCQVTRRKFNIPCTKEGPKERSKYLFPEILTSRHDYRNRRVFISQYMPGMFNMPLTHISGFSMNLNVVEDRSIPRSELMKTYFADAGNGTQHLAQDYSAPIVPVIPNAFKDVAGWISKQVVEIKTELFADLPWKVFPEGKGQDWPRSVLFLFQEFHETIYQSKRIHKVFRTLVVRLLMSRRFFVPYNQMWEFNENLSLEFRESELDLQIREEREICIVPKFINKYFKSALMHLLRDSLKADFVELEAMFKLHEKSPGIEISNLDRDEAFCYVAMILIIVSIMQVKIMQLAISRDHEASQNCPLGAQTQAVQTAKEDLQTIETEVIDHILGLWIYKFVKANRRGTPDTPDQQVAAERAKSYNLLGKFQEKQGEHSDAFAEFADTELDLDEANMSRFLVNNPTRVLLKFAQTLSLPKPRR